jgi:hypothetical protein
MLIAAGVLSPVLLPRVRRKRKYDLVAFRVPAATDFPRVLRDPCCFPMLILAWCIREQPHRLLQLTHHYRLVWYCYYPRACSNIMIGIWNVSPLVCVIVCISFHYKAPRLGRPHAEKQSSRYWADEAPSETVCLEPTYAHGSRIQSAGRILPSPIQFLHRFLSQIAQIQRNSAGFQMSNPVDFTDIHWILEPCLTPL